MKILNNDCHNYYMPAEYDGHEGTLMIWPYREGSWPFGAMKARLAFRQIIWELARREEVYILVRESDWDEAWQMLIQDWYPKNPDKSLEHQVIDNINLFICDTDDAWARDTGPTFVVNKETRDRKGIDWQFNAWGGSYDGLYMSFEKDQQVAKQVCYLLGDSVVDATDFVLEGGSIHVDGQGTLITTEECLLSPGRNPQMSRKDIERKLQDFLGVEKILWLPKGIYNDETNGHVDNMCAFIAPGEVVLAWTENKNDPQYLRSQQAYQYLSQETDARGRKLRIHKLPIPKKPICITEEDLRGYVFEIGEDQRVVGERLAASYVNYYVANSCVLVPQFRDENDSLAMEILAKCFPDREIIPIDALDILLGGGNIHCITQQIPAK